MRWQLGQFFALVGFLALVMFAMTYWANSPTYAYLCSGALVMALGISLMWLGRKPPEVDDRFRSYRSFRKRREERRQARKSKAEEKVKE